MTRALGTAAILLATATLARAEPLTAAQAASHIGERAEVCGVVASAKFSERTRGQPTFLNLDEPYPRQVFTALVWGSSRSRFPAPPESLRGSHICVSGTIIEYKGKPEIVVADPSQIRTR
jgi:hypothetical protein